MSRAIIFFVAFTAGVTLAGLVVADEPDLQGSGLPASGHQVLGRSETSLPSGEARFRLRDAQSIGEVPLVRVPEGASDIPNFSWASLGESGAAASGQIPVVGHGSGQAYYTFPDGQTTAKLVAAAENPSHK